MVLICRQELLNCLKRIFRFHGPKIDIINSSSSSSHFHLQFSASGSFDIQASSSQGSGLTRWSSILSLIQAGE